MKILANELRIGNYVNFKDREDILYCEVTEISIDGGVHIIRHFKDGHVDDQPEIIKDLTPLPLTEYWLLKFGFKTNGIRNWYEIKDGEDMEFTIVLNPTFGTTCLMIHKVEIKSEYVHRLQNLYFELKDKELKNN